MLRPGMRASIGDDGFLNHVESIQYWPWGLVSFTYDGTPLLLDQNNFAVDMSPRVAKALSAWAQSSNCLDPSALGGLSEVKPSTSRHASTEVRALNIAAMKDAHQLRRKVFGSSITDHPLDHPSFGSKFLGAVPRSDSSGPPHAAVVHFGFPSFFVMDWNPIPTGASVQSSKDALSAEELKDLGQKTFEVAMGSEVVGLIVGQDGKSYTLVDSPFYFWPAEGRLQTCGESEVASMLRVPCNLSFPVVQSYFVRITGTS